MSSWESSPPRVLVGYPCSVNCKIRVLGQFYTAEIKAAYRKKVSLSISLLKIRLTFCTGNEISSGESATLDTSLQLNMVTGNIQDKVCFILGSSYTV
jgi:hypothetical protein